MAKGENLDYNVKIGIDSKQFRAEITKCNKETREFKRQQKEAFKQAGESATSGFGKAIAAAKKLAPAIGLGATALKAAQTAMQENQRYTDEWARITESAKASYESFVDSLVNADFSGFFSRIDSVISRAREAADAIDALDTTKIFNDTALAKLNLDVERYKSILKTSTDANEKASAKEAYEKALKEMQNISASNSSAYLNAFAANLAKYVTAKGYNATASDFLTINNQGLAEIKKGSLYDKYYGSLTTYLDWDARYKEEASRRKTIKEIDPATGRVLSRTKGKGLWSDSAFKEARAFMELSDDKLRELFGYLKQGWADQASVYRAITSSARYTGEGRSGGADKSATVYAEGSVAWYEQRISELMKQANESADQAGRQFAYSAAQNLKNELAMIKTDYGGIMQYLPGVGLQGMSVGFKKTTLNTFPSQPITPVTDTSKDLANASEIAINGIELVTDTMRRLGITSEIADEGLRKTLSILGNALAIVGNSIGGVWGKGLTALGGIIGSFEGGGIVGGTSYTGDHLTAKVNSKEMWLSTSQQSRLLGMINGSGGAGGGSYNAMLTGENLYFALRNYGRRTGKIYLP
jgi:hypothetical protein